MNEENQMTNGATSEALEDDNVRPEESCPAIPDRPRKKRKKNYDGSQPLEYPADEAVAQFFATPKQVREFKSLVALAEHLNVSRMTIYRRAQDPDVVERVDWLSMQNIVLGDFVARREWLRIMRAQVRAALDGDTRAAIFCQNRAWPTKPDFSAPSLGEAIGGAYNVASLLEGDETSKSEEPDTAKGNPEMVEDKDSQE